MYSVVYTIFTVVVLILHYDSLSSQIDAFLGLILTQVAPATGCFQNSPMKEE